MELLLVLVAWVLVDASAVLVWAASRRALPWQQPLPAGSIPAPRTSVADGERSHVSPR